LPVHPCGPGLFSAVFCVSLAASYTHFTKEIVPVGTPGLTAGDENKDTFTLTAGFSF
jgi:hypothetical protein